MAETRNEKPDFAVIGERIAEALQRAAEDQLTETQNLVERTKILTENIHAQLREHSMRLADINRRVQGLNDAVNDAHRKFLDGK